MQVYLIFNDFEEWQLFILRYKETMSLIYLCGDKLVENNVTWFPLRLTLRPDSRRLVIHDYIAKIILPEFKSWNDVRATIFNYKGRYSDEEIERVRKLHDKADAILDFISKQFSDMHKEFLNIVEIKMNLELIRLDSCILYLAYLCTLEDDERPQKFMETLSKRTLFELKLNDYEFIRNDENDE